MDLSVEDLQQRKCHVWHNKPKVARLLRERWMRKDVTYFAYRKYITAHREHIASITTEPEPAEEENVDTVSYNIAREASEAMMSALNSRTPSNFSTSSVLPGGESDLENPYVFEQTSHTFNKTTPSGSIVQFSRLHPEILACGGSDGSILMMRCNVNSPPVLLRTLRSHSRRITDLDWSPSDEFLVTCSLDGSTRVWQTAKFLSQTSPEVDQHREPCSTNEPTVAHAPEECFRVFYSKEAIHGVRFHPSNTDFVLAGSQTGEVRVLHISTGRQLASKKLDAPATALEVVGNLRRGA
eukprot:CAMPEP_0118950904 /NCGR_PEP_ID=MMETSP1169-20130426/52202_1 /TAXON_ID=36882 /ORGANISM="Pyramimonas obovata, Strain CCMP722" /LENGTH=295 /DNA_ID=CAMNT_0006897841 /DNA_START=181 /DNA_END=1064 /DNA_ORIENTATION=+